MNVTHVHGKVTYHGDQVVRLFISDIEHLTLLNQLVGDSSFDERGTFVEFWNEPKLNTPADLYVRHDKIGQIFSFLDLAGFKYKTIIKDVQE